MRRRSTTLVCQRGLACTTGAEQREVTRIDEEAVVAQNTLMHRLKRLVIDLQHRMTVFADKVMVGGITHQLEEAHTTAKDRLRHHANRDEQIERTIDRREVDRRIARRRPLQNLISGDMAAVGGQGIE